jgi:uncharacterized membrane protein YgcG
VFDQLFEFESYFVFCGFKLFLKQVFHSPAVAIILLFEKVSRPVNQQNLIRLKIHLIYNTMRIIKFAFISVVLAPSLSREAVASATTSSSKNIGATKPLIILDAVESIQVPYNNIADPNKILNQSANRNVADKLHRHSSAFTVNRLGQIATTSTREERNRNVTEDSKQRNTDVDNSEFPIQIAVALVEQMDFVNNDAYRENEVDMEEIARQFAMSLHNKWGIGQEMLAIDEEDSTESNISGGTGVLLFLSVRDRVVFISVGGALKQVLTSGRIKRIIHKHMTAELKRANFELGLTRGIDAIVELLERGEEPSLLEKFFDRWFNMDNIVVFVWIICVLGNVLKQWKRQREQRIYAKVAVQFSELDRAKAQALRGSYQRITNCPICLEDFSSKDCGSDGQPLQLLRCGHVFDKTCYQKWISSGRGHVTKCPVCRADVGPNSADLPRLTTENNEQFPSFESHAGSTGDDDPDGSSGTNGSDITNVNGSLVYSDGNNNALAESSSDQNTNMMTRYRMDRNFRLERLEALYPRHVSADAITNWSSSTFNGSLVGDHSLRNRDVAVTPNACCSCRPSTTNSECVFDKEIDHRVDFTFGGGTSEGGQGVLY